MEIGDDGHEGVVVNPTTKTGESRRIGIDQRTADLIGEHRQRCVANAERFVVELTEDDYLFSDGPGSATPWRPARITRAFIRARDDLAKKGAKGIKNVRLGDLRHYAASQLLSARLDPLYVSKRLGNSPRTLLANYSHYIPADDHAAADHMAGLFKAK
jgi:integrase